MTKLKGIIDRYRYQGEGYWSIAVLASKEVIVGVLTGCNEGDTVELTGDWVDDPKWGKQFKVASSRVIAAEDARGIVAWMEKLPGIGPRRAAAIVDALGAENVFASIEQDPEVLLTIPGITRDRMEHIVNRYHAMSSTRDIMVSLRRYLTEGQAARVIERWGSSALDHLKENPYALIDLDGIGFKTADSIAMKMGVAKDATERVKAIVMQFLRNGRSVLGHCYLRADDIIAASLKKLSIPRNTTRNVIASLVERGTLNDEDGNIYMASLHTDEVVVARELTRISLCR